MNISQEISRRLRYGLMIQSIMTQLGKLGFYISPFYLHLEGTFGRDCQHSYEELKEYDIGFLGPEDMREIAEIAHRNQSENQLSDRLDQGKKCFGAKFHGKLVAFTWCDFESCHSSLYRFKLKKHEAYLFDAYTLMSFRGRNIAPFLRFKCYQALELLGRSRLYSITLCFNAPALKFKEKINARPLMLGLYIQILKKWRWSWKVRSYCYYTE